MLDDDITAKYPTGPPRGRVRTIRALPGREAYRLSVRLGVEIACPAERFTTDRHIHTERDTNAVSNRFRSVIQHRDDAAQDFVPSRQPIWTSPGQTGTTRPPM